MKHLFIIAIAAFTLNACGQSENKESTTDTEPIHVRVDKKGVALDGYDAVSYFQSNPTQGKASIQYTYKDVVFFFSTEENKTTFAENPEMYIPAYGGWCAYAVGEFNKKVSVNPETFKIIDDKLYLFYNKSGNNTLTKWNADEASLKEKADKNWSTLKN